MANRAAGKGYENENFYENIKFQFCGIENIHVMRSSLSKLLEACELKTPSMAAFINGIQSSGWLRHIHAILDTSLLVARSLQEGVNVLVHCSDGQFFKFEKVFISFINLIYNFQDGIEQPKCVHLPKSYWTLITALYRVFNL